MSVQTSCTLYFMLKQSQTEAKMLKCKRLGYTYRPSTHTDVFTYNAKLNFLSRLCGHVSLLHLLGH